MTNKKTQNGVSPIDDLMASVTVNNNVTARRENAKIAKRKADFTVVEKMIKLIKSNTTDESTDRADMIDFLKSRLM